VSQTQTSFSQDALAPHDGLHSDVGELGLGVGMGVGSGVGIGVGSGVGSGVGAGVGSGVGTFGSEHSKPSPINPSLQSQPKDPIVLKH